ncbi:MAG: single-stranded-DNA-specific exonuclease RecJ [Bacillota bacterium]|nr:single-stranded-DNA-specific exonuclease RecJ [Bacillota bacterium]
MENISPVVKKILEKRGITEEDDIREFLSDRPQRTYDPFLLSDMREGVDLVLSAVDSDENICIYGDYDTDGITSISILFEVLTEVIVQAHSKSRLSYYIPSRFTEGYGLNNEAIDKIKKDGAQMIITVDCGSTSVDAVEHAKKEGLKILVTDHHNISDKQADCLIINPKRKDDTYPCKDLAGCGVAFKLAQALQRASGISRSTLNRTLDLVAVGTVGDIVPLTDENRTIVKYGLAVIRKGEREGLRDLIGAISLEPSTVGSEEIAFGIVPNLNSTGRMDTATWGVRLMLAASRQRSIQMADKITGFNDDRKYVQKKAFEKCCEIVERDLADKDMLIIDAGDIHEGIAGIVAGNIKEQYEKPTIILMDSEESVKGTGRSIGEMDLYETLHRHAELFTKFGGHKKACGFSLDKEKVAEFISAMDEDVAKQLEENPELFREDTIVDAVIVPREATLDLYDQIVKLEPFGCGNPQPVFRMEDVTVKWPKRIGADGTSASFAVYGKENDRISCVLFRKADQFDECLRDGKHTDITGYLRKNIWKDRVSIQFVVENISPHNGPDPGSVV